MYLYHEGQWNEADKAFLQVMETRKRVLGSEYLEQPILYIESDEAGSRVNEKMRIAAYSVIGLSKMMPLLK
jgi:hypothetical protein